MVPIGDTLASSWAYATQLTSEGGAIRPISRKEGEVMNSVAMNVLAALALCVLVVTVAMLLVPNIAWADVFEYLTTQPPCKGPSI